MGEERIMATTGLEPGAWGFPKVKGQCPGCSNESLFLAVGGYVTCSYIPCPNPTAASDLLTTHDINVKPVPTKATEALKREVTLGD